MFNLFLYFVLIISLAGCQKHSQVNQGQKMEAFFNGVFGAEETHGPNVSEQIRRIKQEEKQRLNSYGNTDYFEHN